MEEQKTAPANLKRYLFPLIVLAVCLALGGYVYWSQNQGSKLPVEGKGADYSYTDTEGKTVSLSNTNGKVRLLYFFFSYCPDVCPPTTFLMSKVQDELKKDGVFGSKVQFQSVTVDPSRDTPERLKEFAGKFQADFSGWKFLRGNEKATADIAMKYQIFVQKDPATGDFSHSNLIVLLDKKGQIRDWISANEYFANGEKNRPMSEIVGKIKDLL